MRNSQRADSAGDGRLKDKVMNHSKPPRTFTINDANSLHCGFTSPINLNRPWVVNFRVKPTSMSTAPSFTISGRIKPGTPVAWKTIIFTRSFKFFGTSKKRVLKIQRTEMITSDLIAMSMRLGSGVCLCASVIVASPIEGKSGCVR